MQNRVCYSTKFAKCLRFNAEPWGTPYASQITYAKQSVVLFKYWQGLYGDADCTQDEVNGAKAILLAR